MAWSYFIYSPLSYKEILELEESYSVEFTRFIDENPEILENDEGAGLVLSEKKVPTKEEVLKTYKEFEMEVSPAILGKLAACQAAMEIERPVPPHKSRLQVSVLIFLLERMGDCLVDWGDHQLEMGEPVLAKLRRQKNFGVMGAPRSETDGESGEDHKNPELDRAEKIIDILHASEHNPELALDLQRVLRREPEPVVRYIAYLIHNGAATIEQGAKMSSLAKPDFDRLLRAFEAKLTELTAPE